MGMNSEFAMSNLAERHALCFDLETVPMPGCEAFIDMDGISAPANYKDEAKIAAYIESAKRKEIDRAGLDLDLCEIVAIGWHRTDNDTGRAWTRQHGSEVEMLTAFWLAAETSGLPLLGFNVLHFDLPVLLRRSLYLGVSAPVISIDRYRHDRVIDLAEVLSYGRKELLRSLSFYAKRFGIEHDDSVSGADIAGLVAKGDWTKVEHHCWDDVQTTVALARRVGVISAVPALAEVI